MIVAKVSQALGEPAARLGASVAYGLRLSLEQAINTLFVVSTVIGVVGLVIVVFLPEVRLRMSHSADQVPGDGGDGQEAAVVSRDAIAPVPAPET